MRMTVYFFDPNEQRKGKQVAKEIILQADTVPLIGDTFDITSLGFPERMQVTDREWCAVKGRLEAAITLR